MNYTMETSQGLYRAFDKSGALLYVGISKNIPIRLQTHGARSFWFNEVATITIERFEDDGLLRAAELAAISTENPKYNLKRAELRKRTTQLRGLAAAERRVEISRLRRKGATYQEIATLFGLSRERVRQLLAQQKMADQKQA